MNNWFSWWSFGSESSRHCLSQSVRAGELKFWKNDHHSFFTHTGIGANICISQEIQCFLYAIFLSKVLSHKMPFCFNLSLTLWKCGPPELKSWISGLRSYISWIIPNRQQQLKIRKNPHLDLIDLISGIIHSKPQTFISGNIYTSIRYL